MRLALKIPILCSFALLALLTAMTATGQDNNKDEGTKKEPTSQTGSGVGVTFTSRTDLVLVPVVVSDKPGTHISGLTKNDFEIQEDGKSKPVATLEEVKTFTSRAARSTPQPGVYTNALTTGSSPQRLTIFALDLVNTPFLDQTYAREQLMKYLAHRVSSQEPSALLAIRSNGLQVLHDFTSDPAVLVAALKNATGETSTIQAASLNGPGGEATFPLVATSPRPFDPQQISGESQALTGFINGNGPDAQAQIQKQALAITVTLQAFQNVAEAFAGIPGRKSLIWATASFPFGLDAASGAMLSPAQYQQGGILNAPLFGSRADSSGKLPSFPAITNVLNSSELTRLIPLYERTLQMLNDANIAVYPVDARGMVVFFAGADVSRVEGLNSFNATIFEGDRDTMANLAAMTGGQAFYNRNDLDVAFQKAADDSASYYLLGYYLDKNDKPGWHRLHVKVKRNGAVVRARSGFFVTSEAMQADAQRMDMSLALVSPLDYTALPLAVRWSGVKADGAKKKIHFQLTLPPDSNVVDTTRNGLLDLEVAAIAHTATGKPADQFSQTVKANLKGGALQESMSTGVNYNNDMILPAGEYSVRFVVRDNSTGRLGSVMAPLQVTP